MTIDDIQRVAVLGTGMMGPSIALLFARAGYDTMIWGRDDGGVERGRRSFEKNAEDLLAERIISTQEAAEAEKRIRFTNDLKEAVGATDFVSEAVIENLEIKQDLLAHIEDVCPAAAILTSNTSTLLPSDLNRKMRTPERMLVAHFWNPAHLVPLVEVCGSPKTSAASIDATMAILRKIGHEPVLMKKEILGFIGNRIMHAMNREALSLVEKGVVTPEEVDKVILASFGPRFANLGPLEYLDFCGLDHIRRIQAYLYGDLDNTPGVLPVLDEKVARGELGCKTGKGLFDWAGRDSRGPRVRRDQEFLRRLSAKRGGA